MRRTMLLKAMADLPALSTPAMNRLADRLLHASPHQVLRAATRAWHRVSGQARHDDFTYGWALDTSYRQRQAALLATLFRRLDDGEPLDRVLQGFDGRQFGERVVEYPYACHWLREGNAGVDHLDIGCVLNYQPFDAVLRRHCRSLTLCNPALEVPQISVPLYYHVADLARAFPRGETFASITCLSTIEHIGFDNSQYGSDEPARYDAPTLEPWLESLERIVELLAPRGRFMVSVPYGHPEARRHRATRRLAFQVFGYEALCAAESLLEGRGIRARAVVFAGGETGWDRREPDTVTSPYAKGFPGASAVAFIEGIRAD